MNNGNGGEQLNKRELFAAMAMQALVFGDPKATRSADDLAVEAVEVADALIAELQNGKQV